MPPEPPPEQEQEQEQEQTTDDAIVSQLSFTSELQPRPDEIELTEQEAADILVRRLGFDFKRDTTGGEDFRAGLGAPWFLLRDRDRLEGEVGDKDKNGQATDLMLRVVRMLPAEMRTQSVMSNLDIRPILSEIGVSERDALLRNEGTYLNDVYVPPEERAIATSLLEMETENVRAQAEAVALAKNSQGEFASAAEREAWVEERVGRWMQSEELGATPALDQEIMEADSPAAAAAELQAQNLSGFEDFYSNVPGLPQDNQLPDWYVDESTLEWMYGMGMYDWNGVLSTEAYKQDLRDQGVQGVDEDFMVDTGGLANLGTPPSGGSGFDSKNGGYPDAKPAGTRVRLLDVYNSLLQPNRKMDEIRNLQDKLIAGGFLNEDEVLWEGRGYDPATKKAWTDLVELSLATKKDMKTLLGDATVAKRIEDEEENKKMSRDLVLTSGVGIQTTADVLGQQVLGRTLSGDDHARLIEFVHTLERDAHMTVDPEGGQEVENVDVNAEIEAWIERENGPEAGAYDMLEQMAAFNDFVRRPG